ncbi:MAG: DUF2868 domain-containing protein [Gammaproteobacteria bacterium]
MQAVKQYLAAETWRIVEEAEGAPRRDSALEAALRAQAAAFDARVQARAERFLAATPYGAATARLQSRLGIVRGVLVGVAFFVGLGVTGVFPRGDGGSVNVVSVLGTLLLPHALSLALWGAGISAGLFATVRRKFAGRGTEDGAPFLSLAGWLGTQVARAVRLLDPRRQAGPPAQALTHYLLRQPGGRARLALLSHAVWLALLFGAWLGCSAWFTLRQVDFHWGSTVLAEATVARALGVAMQPVAACGIEVPSPAEIARSRLGSTEPRQEEVRQRWGYFVLGALWVYGLLPRAIAMLLTYLLRVLHDRRLQLDSAEPGYARLRALLSTDSNVHVLDADDSPHPRPVTATSAPASRAETIGAWLALERQASPPAGVLCDLGVVTDRAGQRDAIDRVARATDWPRLTLQASLATTPDRGLERFVAALVEVAHCPIVLRLADDADALAWSAADRAQRREDWVALARRAGLPAGNVRGPGDEGAA